MSGFFMLGIGAAFGVEKFDLQRLGVVVMSVIGVVLVSNSDQKVGEDETAGKPLLGDVLALISAGLYAFYVLLMKVRRREFAERSRLLTDAWSGPSARRKPNRHAGWPDETPIVSPKLTRLRLQMFFGFVGVINTLAVWPVGVVLHYTGIEPFHLPHTRKVWFLVVINACITVVSDYLCAPPLISVGAKLTRDTQIHAGDAQDLAFDRDPRSSSISSEPRTRPFAHLPAQGLSLTLPLAVLGDLVKGEAVGVAALLGGALVLGSFVLLSYLQRESSPA